eukprot:scaffold1866_cov277-Pinguiococcus_pyrenoidosus.AAC.3
MCARRTCGRMWQSPEVRARFRLASLLQTTPDTTLTTTTSLSESRSPNSRSAFGSASKSPPSPRASLWRKP